MTYYEIGQGENILFLHGMGCDGLTHRKLLVDLSKNYRVVSPDLPCFGESSIPRDIWGLKDFADFLNGFAEDINLKETTIIGHSLGGGIALHLAQNSNLFKKLVLVDNIGKVTHFSLAEYRYRITVEESYFAILKYFKIYELLQAGVSFVVNRIIRGDQWNHIIDIMKNCSYHDFENYDNIKIPTLILWGDHDHIVLPIYGKYTKEKIPNSTLVIVEGNHGWIKYDKDLFLKKFYDWVNWLDVNAKQNQEFKSNS